MEIIKFISLSSIILILGCVNPISKDSDSDGSIVGIWVMVRETGGDRPRSYDPSFDYYYEAKILQFTSSGQEYTYRNQPGPEWSSDTANAKISDNKIIYDFGTITFALNNGQLILLAGADSTFFSSYSGSIPPASWTQTIRANDSFEPDNSAAMAKPVIVGTSAERINIPDDVDYMKFQAVAGKLYQIAVTGRIDPELKLFGPDGATVFATDYDTDLYIEGYNGSLSIGGPFARLFSCTTSGPYYCSVKGLSGGEEGRYTLKITEKVPVTGPIIGTWVLTQELYKANGVVQRTINHNPSFSDYYDAFIITVTPNKVYEYKNATGSLYESDTINCSASLNDIIIDGRVWAYSIIGGMISLSVGSVSGEYIRVCAPYTGTIPPASWLQFSESAF